jgi:uncharacterized protein (DUF433 family)
MTGSPVEYVLQTPEGGWRIRDSRVSLDSVVHAYRDGLSPEAIAGEFPSLSLEQIHGALAFYLRHREAIDRYLDLQESRWEQLRQESEGMNDELLKRLRDTSDKDVPR